MVTAHRTLDGGWTVCADQDRCGLLFHFPDMTPEQMADVPEAVLWTLCEVVDPPGPDVARHGDKVWQNAMGEAHRDYDLPAGFRNYNIAGYGRVEWRQYGLWHRDHDGPAIIHEDGKQEWYQFGRLHREGGPAIIWPDGRAEVWLNGLRRDEPVRGLRRVLALLPHRAHWLVRNVRKLVAA